MSDDDIQEIRSTAEKLMAQAREREREKEIAIENLEEYRKALNDLAQSNNGKLVFKILIKALGVFAVKPNRDGMALVGDKALRDFYLTMIRPHLEPANRQELEP